ncbi:class I SAM-dependent methyltransferase [Eubacterium sp. 1001713B170207_170306_E7]|uniref:class I SAM-dependent methyltransferase n=1 Tax=Eubacterium sp. 1001713B170207_170306_E7 TaxID=2787097 RepID=UPI0018976BD2|nr:class I SAM-dependent methyltransferase [Eubacterium sp. 1001713B170207_170306_E7]
MELQLGDVGVTALIPLSNRASETLRKHPRIRDEKAVEIIRMLDIDTKDYDKLFTHECVIARTIMFDNAVEKLLKKYPDGVCVNMGCGLDDRFQRVDNGRTIWFDVDLPASIKVRKSVYEETKRRRMIGASVIDTDWIEAVKTAAGTNPVIVIAEGLFMYFSREQTKTIINNLTTFFDKGFLVVEMMNPSMMDEKKHETVKHTDAKFGWGTKSGREFEALDAKIKLISEKSFAEQLRKSTLISKIIGILSAKLNNRLAVFRWQQE